MPSLLGATVFLNILGNQEVYDEHQTFSAVERMRPASWSTYVRRGRGLTYAVHAADRAIWGTWLPGRRITNIVLHCGAASLAAGAAFVLTRRRAAALVCGLLFAVHPVHVEAVAGIPFRKDVLAMIFVELALIFWLARRRQVLGYVAALVALCLGLLAKEAAAVGLIPMLFLADLLRSGAPHGGAGGLEFDPLRTRAGRAGASGVSHTRGLAPPRSAFARAPAELVAVPVPSCGGQSENCMSLVGSPVGSGDLRRRIVRAAWRALPIFAVGVSAIVYFAGDLRQYFESGTIAITTRDALTEYAQVPPNVACAWLAAARVLVFPLRLAADYPISASLGLLTPCVAGGIALGAAWLAICAWTWRRAPLVAFATMWCLLTFAPASNIVPVGQFFLAERYLYVPSFGVCLLAALGLEWAWTWVRTVDAKAAQAREGHSRGVPARRAGAQTASVNRKQTHAAALRPRLAQAIFACACAAALAGLGTRTVLRNRDWRDEYTLWSAAVRDGFSTPTVRYNLGHAMQARQLFAPACEQYREAIRLDPDRVATRVNLGSCLLALRRLDEAETVAREAVRLAPHQFDAQLNLAMILHEQNRAEEAIEQYRRTLRINSASPVVHFNLAWLLRRQGRPEEALAEYRRSLQYHETANARVNVGNILVELGRVAEAVAEYRAALRAEPKHALAHAALNDALAMLKASAAALPTAPANRPSRDADPPELP